MNLKLSEKEGINKAGKKSKILKYWWIIFEEIIDFLKWELENWMPTIFLAGKGNLKTKRIAKKK